MAWLVGRLKMWLDRWLGSWTGGYGVKGLRRQELEQEQPGLSLPPAAGPRGIPPQLPTTNRQPQEYLGSTRFHRPAGTNALASCGMVWWGTGQRICINVLYFVVVG
jgi:hypothetical protein